MRVLQAITLKLMCIALLLVGGALIRYPSSELYHMVAVQFPDNDVWRLVVAIMVCAVAVWGIIPLPRRQRKSRSISFADGQDNTTIELDSIAQALSREISKQPEVKRIAITFEPADDERRVRLSCNAVIRKGPGASTRDISARLRQYVADQGRQILGPGEVVGVDLTIQGIIVDRGKSGAPVLEEVPVDLPGEDAEKKTEAGGLDEEPRLRYVPEPFETPEPEEPASYDEQEEPRESDTLPGTALPSTGFDALTSDTEQSDEDEPAISEYVRDEQSELPEEEEER